MVAVDVLERVFVELQFVEERRLNSSIHSIELLQDKCDEVRIENIEREEVSQCQR